MCIFCKIVNKEIPSSVVMENDEFLAFHDISPAAKVHVLIIPKDHYDSFDVTPADVMGKMTLFIQDVAKELGIKDSGYRLITNIGDHGGQEVKHLHMHLLAGEYVGGLVGQK